jgi:hypothetical protein
MNWSKSHKSCKNCGTERRKHKSKGYCTMCYTLIKKIEDSNSWRFNEPKTFKSTPQLIYINDKQKFENSRSKYQMQITERLDFLRYNEEMLQGGNIKGIDLEYAFDRLAKICGVNKGSLFHGSAAIFDNDFNAEQRTIIYEYINRIVESKRWKGINWYKIF